MWERGMGYSGSPKAMRRALRRTISAISSSASANDTIDDGLPAALLKEGRPSKAADAEPNFSIN